MDQCIDSFEDVNIFWYWQQTAATQSYRENSICASHTGIFQFIRMSPGFRTVLGTLLRAVDIISSTFHVQFALVSLDDVVIFSKSPEDHNPRLRHVFSLLYDAVVTSKLQKCELYSNAMHYLGHIIIQDEQIVVSQHTIDETRDLKPSTSITKPQWFLGYCNDFWRFVLSFTRIAAPLSKNCEKINLLSSWKLPMTNYLHKKHCSMILSHLQRCPFRGLLVPRLWTQMPAVQFTCVSLQ